jgi:RNA-directed DNA polymerase
MAQIAVADVVQLSQYLGITTGTVYDLRANADRHYKVFRLPKRGGRGYRKIAAPSKVLKGFQRWILVYVLRQIQISPAATAFRPRCSVLKNADQHTGRDFVANIDLKDFFPTISSNRVFELYRSLGYSAEIASTFTRICTYRGRLPQGAPTSPDIANLICRKLDGRLVGYCSKRGYGYTRYCDDITISGEKGFSRSSFQRVSEIIADEGFLINLAKFRVNYKTNCQLVTGLVVNESANLPRYLRLRLRAVFFQANHDPRRFVPRVLELTGYYAYLKSITPSNPCLPNWKAVIDGITESMDSDART